MRQLRLRMSDDTVRSVMVDENQPVANLMVILCTKLGITNHDEYSLIATGKHTINGRRRDKGLEGRVVDQKMEQLKKKLKTDEDLAWVDHSKTLDEQEIHEQDVVLLRRRFFYSDHIVDSRDPIQLGLLYVQTRDAILSGTHPVNLDGACRFAGLQCQAQLGDFAEAKSTRPGYLNLKDCLPAEYAKVKHVERKIWLEHRRHLGMGELEAKAAYVQEARALPTYGVTFFLVKEKVAGKNRLVPRLLGITKDCVLRVDADTKGILKQWPLTTVKRWAPSKNSFTLDFGDYSDSYYSVQTTEGEQIGQLIAGYIDIILRRRKAKDHFGIEGDEGATMIEDSVAPSRATIIKNQTRQPPAQPPAPVEEPPVNNWTRTADGVQRTLHRTGPIVEPGEFTPAVEVQGRAEIGYEARPPTQYVASYEPSPPQRDFQDRLDQAQEAVEDAQKVLDRSETTMQQQQHLMADSSDRDALENKKRRLSNQFAEINAATAQLVSLSAIPEEELNYPALNTAVETVAQHLPSLAEDVRLVATLMDDHSESERLIEAARKLCKAFSDLLSAAEPGPTVPRQSLISAASRVGDATQALLFTVQANAHDQESADMLLSSAKTVASSAAALVLKAKDIATWCNETDPALGNQVIGSATQCALATSQMVATAKIVAPTIHDTNCQKKLVDSCREVERAVNSIRVSCQRALREDEQQLCDLQESVRRVTEAVEELLEQVRSVKYNNQIQLQQMQQQRRNNRQQQQRQQNQQTTTTSTTTTTQRIVQVECEDNDDEDRSADENTAESEDPNKSELVNQARTLARATTQLIQDMRPEQQQQHHHHANNYQNYQSNSEHRVRVESDEIEREEPPKIRQHHNNNNKQQQQQQDSTTTITTTVYDERDERERPVSQYEYEQQSSRQQHHHEQQSTSHDYNEEQQQVHTRDKDSRAQSTEQDELPEATISGIVGDLETTIMFATAGTLRAQDQHESYLYYREHVLECAKALVEDTRPLVASASSDHVQLAQAAQESVMTMARLAEAVKSSAATLGPNNAESQAGLIRSVKEVAESLSELIGSTKSALGCEPYDQRLMQVKESAKGMVGSVTSLLRTVKSVEEEQQRGLRAIEVALDAIDQELTDYEVRCSEQPETGSQQQQQRAQVDELARMSRPVSMATAKTVHAASSGLQDDAIVAANMGRKAIVDLLRTTCSVGQQADSYELRARIQEAGRNSAVNYKRLLELLHRIFQHPSIAAANPDFKQELISQSKIIAACVVELESCNQQQSLIISQRKVPGIAQEISACEQILRKEKELEVAKTQLIALRKAKYSNRPDDYKGYGGSLE